jgi:hypothetical protein
MGKSRFASCGTGNTMRRGRNRKSMVYVCFSKLIKLHPNARVCVCVNFNLSNAFAMQVV